MTERARRPVLEAAVEALARRDFAERELERALRRRAYAPEEIADAIVRLRERGLLDDTRFAFAFARSRVANRSMGVRRIVAELTRRGVAGTISKAAVDEAFGSESVDEREVMRRVAERRLRGLSSLTPEAQRRRLMGFLARRGFGGETLRSVVRELIPR